MNERAPNQGPGAAAATERAKPTTLQLQILCFIAAHIDVTGHAPRLREITEYFWLAPGAAQYHVERLKLFGYVRRFHRSPNALHVTQLGRRAIGLREVGS